MFGEMLLQGLLPLETFGLFSELGLSFDLLKPLLEACRQPITAGELERIFSALQPGRELCDRASTCFGGLSMTCLRGPDASEIYAVFVRGTWRIKQRPEEERSVVFFSLF